MHLATGDINVEYGSLPPGEDGVDTTVATMAKLAKGIWGSRSAKIRALSINIINAAGVADKDYYGMAEAIHNWVRDTIRYVRDPIGADEDGSTINQETLSTPEETAFNSQAGDCDDKSILEMAMLGSVGIQSYPVVIGLDPNRRSFSHVYINIIMPPGNYPQANQTIPADPIMRQWPLGKEAPAHKVTTKKLYTELAGLNDMTLGAYARGPSYLTRSNVSSVVPALRSVLTDTGGRGRIMTVDEVLRPSEDLDDMFASPLQVATKPADRNQLRPRGPITQHANAMLTSYLSTPGLQPASEGRVIMGKRSGPKIVTINRRRIPGPQTIPADAGPGFADLAGLSDLLDNLQPAAKAQGKAASYQGKGDILNTAVAAMTLANAHARKARANRDRQIKNLSMFGLGADTAAVDAAADTEKAAHAVLEKAMQTAVTAAGTSPARQSAMHQVAARMRMLDQGVKSPDMVNALVKKHLPSTAPIGKAAVGVATMVALAHDSRVVGLAQHSLASKAHFLDKAAKRAAGMQPLKTHIPGMVVRDQFGRTLAAPGLAGFGSFMKNVGKTFTSAIVASIIPTKSHIASLTGHISKLPGLKSAAKLPSMIGLQKKSKASTGGGNGPLSIAFGDPSLSIPAGGTASPIQAVLTSGEQGADTFSVSVVSSLAGILTISGAPTSVAVPANGQALISFSAAVSPNSQNASGTITITCTSQSNPSIVVTNTIQVMIGAAAAVGGAGVVVTAPSVSGPYPPSQPITLSFTVMNNEGVNDTFNLQATSSNPTDMPAQLSIMQIPLAAGQSTQVSVTVTPDTAMQGRDVSVTLTATSATNGAVSSQGYASFSILATNQPNMTSQPYGSTMPMSPNTDPSSYDSSYDANPSNSADTSADPSANDVTSSDSTTYGDSSGGDGSEAGPSGGGGGFDPSGGGGDGSNAAYYAPPGVDDGSSDSSYNDSSDQVDDGSQNVSYTPPSSRGLPPGYAYPAAAAVPQSILAQLTPAQLQALSPADLQAILASQGAPAASSSQASQPYYSPNGGDDSDTMSGIGAFTTAEKAGLGLGTTAVLAGVGYLVYRHLRKRRRK